MHRVLIANRGEIAIRIAAAVAAQGMESVAVFAAADELALHPRAATTAVALPEAGDPVATYLQVEAVIADFLEEKGLDKKARVSPSLKEKLSFQSLQVSYGNTRGDDLVSITPALCAVAETGSLVLVSGEDTPTSLNFLPEVHIVVITTEQMVPHIEDAWTQIRALEGTPRAINFITGPSRTADVEQTLQIGAHGPRDLLVVLAG